KIVTIIINVDPTWNRRDTKMITGTTNPGGTLTIALLDSGGNAITTFTAKAEKDGKYSISNTVPVDGNFGKYTVSVSDGKNQVSKQYSVVSTHQIYVSTLQQKYNPGQTVVINGTAISNQIVSFVIKDPAGRSVFAKDVNVTSGGKISLNYTLSDSAIKGTYAITAARGSDQVPVYFGVGEDFVPPLTVSLDG